MRKKDSARQSIQKSSFKPIAQNFLLSISSRRIEAISVTSSFLNSRTIDFKFKARGLSFHISDLNGAKKRADNRIPALLKVPAVVHFLSVEPLLEAVDLGNISEIDWVIVGGESGPRCRPMKIEWARQLRDQCKAASIPFFMKQMSGRIPGKVPIPPDLMIREFPKYTSRIRARACAIPRRFTNSGGS